MTHTLTLHLPPELYQLLKEHAGRQNKRLEELALQALQKELGATKENPPTPIPPFEKGGAGGDLPFFKGGAFYKEGSLDEDPLAHADIWAPPEVRGAPKDLAEEHDYYAYGGRKRHRRNGDGGIKMSETQGVTFHKVLEMVEMLPEEEQETLLDVIQHRLRERGRERIAQNVRKARREYAKGKIRQGTVEDLMKEIVA